MLLTATAALFFLGLATWLAGAYFSYTGVAVLGAAIIVGVGAGIAIDGLEVVSGETRTVNDTTNTTTIEEQTEPIAFFDNFPLGTLVVLVGALLFVQPLNETIQ